ncbi:hypothetical protein [Haladaptatus sp. NG-WS-4]
MTTPRSDFQSEDGCEEDEPPDDERVHYGEPQHEFEDETDPDEKLYGTPQHETSEPLDDFELLLLERTVDPQNTGSEGIKL